MKFREKLEIEQLREIETQAGSSVNVKPGESERHFEHWLLKRVEHYKKQPNYNGALTHGPSVFKHIQTFILFFGLLLGLLSGSGLLSAEQENVNVFWLLGALLGAHTFSLLLWALLSIYQTQGQAGPLSSIWEYLVSHIINRKQAEQSRQAANRAWWMASVDGKQGKWLLSILSHQFWLSFIAGCSISLLLVFTTQQFDFIWESTLLSQNQFNLIIQFLAYPFNALGLAWPVMEGETEIIRRTWAFFILSCLLVYAFLPRCLALLISKVVLSRLQNKWQPDWSLDYFIDLKAEFQSHQFTSLVVDHDPASKAQPFEDLTFSNAHLPENALYYGLEVDPANESYTSFPKVQNFLNDQAAIEQYLKLSPSVSQPVVIFVMGDRVVDRGTRRKLKLVQAPNTWLLVLTPSSSSSTKAQAWLHAAQSVGWDLNCVVLRENL